MKLKVLTSIAAACVVATFAIGARAQDQGAAAAAAPPAPPAPPPLVPLPYDLKLTGHIEGGATYNTDSPNNNINFGQTFTDSANTFRMNQAMLGLEKDLDPKDAGFQLGFKVQGMYGTDSRVTHFYGEFDRVTNSPYQWDVVEAAALLHVPSIGGGTDMTVGQYPTPIGYEVIDATGNPFYTHSYIFNYGLPFKHTGLLTTTHINDMIDLWLGVDTGINDSILAKGMVNNEFPKFLGGFGLNGLAGGNLTILALAHIGPEASHIAEGTGPNALGGGSMPLAGPAQTNCAAGVPSVCGFNSYVTQIYDVVITYKISDALTSTTELNVIKNDLLKATGGGAATYLSFAYNDQWTFNARAEAFADQNGAFVADAYNSTGYVNALRGRGPAILVGTCNSAGIGPTCNVTLGELTLGATWKPPLPWNNVNFMIRPEVRYDTVIGGGNTKPYDVTGPGLGTKTSQFTAAVDFTVGF